MGSRVLNNGIVRFSREVDRRVVREDLAIVIGVVAVLAVTPAGPAQTYTVLHSFTGDPGGSDPYGRLVRDSEGNLYGTTWNDGANDLGAVFMLANLTKYAVS